MKKWIRWQGLIPFVLFVAAALLFWFLLLGPLVKWAVEKTGTAIVGAEVDLGRADVTLSPLGVTLSRLQVTDPGEPMRNAVEIGRIAFSLDGLDLLRRKIIINEMSAEGIMLGTERKTSGAIVKQKKKEESNEAKKKAFGLPSFELPDVKEIVEKERLESLRLAESLPKEINGAEDVWKRKMSGLPDKDRIVDYRKRVEKLKATKKRGAAELLQAAADAKSLAADIRRDLDRVNSVRNDLSADVVSWKKKIDRAEQAPGEDARRLRVHYGFSPEGLRNMSAMIFGNKIGDWIGSGIRWYGRLQPVLERASGQKGKTETVKPLRGRGVDVRFRERHPLPDFLIRTIKVSARPEAGVFDGTIRNVTPDQDVLGSPITFALSGRDMKNIGSLELDGKLDHVVPARSEDRMTVRLQRYAVRKMILSDSGSLPVTLKTATADCVVQADRRSGGISATITAEFRSVDLDTGGKSAGSPLIASIAKSLSGVKDFTLTAKVNGSPEDYDIKISSDLDRVLQQAAGRFVKDQGDRFERKLEAMIAEKTSGGINEAKASLGGLNALSKDLNTTDSALNGLLNEALKTGKAGIKLPF